MRAQSNELEPTMSVTVGHLKVPDVTLCSTVCRGSSPPCTLQDTRRLNVRLCNRAESYPTVKRSSADEDETEDFPFSWSTTKTAWKLAMTVGVGHLSMSDLTAFSISVGFPSLLATEVSLWPVPQ